MTSIAGGAATSCFLGFPAFLCHRFNNRVSVSNMWRVAGPPLSSRCGTILSFAVLVGLLLAAAAALPGAAPPVFARHHVARHFIELLAECLIPFTALPLICECCHHRRYIASRLGIFCRLLCCFCYCLRFSGLRSSALCHRLRQA
jgi:hypothetical protein